MAGWWANARDTVPASPQQTHDAVVMFGQRWANTSSGCIVFSEYPSEQDTLTQCWFNVGSASATLAQH